MTAPETLEEIRNDEAGFAYPRAILDGCESALVLFAAGFHGRQDAFWIANAGLTATCVDTDAGRLMEMRSVYPDGWEFFTDNAYEFVSVIADTTDLKWDVVSVDCPSGAFDRCAELVGDWCRLATRAVILGTGKTTSVSAPVGWEITDRRKRSTYDGGVFWTVLEPA